ncbi:MAG: aminotransferase class IV [Bacteroidota bacterium]
MSEHPRTYVWLDDQWLEPDELRVAIGSDALRYGLGWFETFRTWDGRVPSLAAHLNRLESAVRWWGADPGDRLDPEFWRERIRQLVSRNGHSDGNARVRFQLLLHDGRFLDDHGSVNRSSGSLLLTSGPLPPVREAVDLVISDTTALPDRTRPSRFKWSARTHYLLAEREATREGADDAILLTTDGYISETTRANLFWKQDDVIYTPDLSCDLLPGLMRERLLQLIQSRPGWRVARGTYTPESLKRANQVWLTNSLRGLEPVRQVGTHRYDVSSPFLDELSERLREQLNRELEQA